MCLDCRFGWNFQRRDTYLNVGDCMKAKSASGAISAQIPKAAIPLGPRLVNSLPAGRSS
jgi:hypothetical protein